MKNRVIPCFLAAAICLICGGSVNAATPPERSTFYNPNAGASGYTFPHRSAYNQSEYITLEAWVYRMDASRCETIISQDYRSSFWFGFCPNLRFYRSGGLRADSGVSVPAFRWTHVAVSYDASNARFYIDGELVSTQPLSHAGRGQNNQIMIGKDPGGYEFYGYLDEVRVWTGARSFSAIRDGRFRELRSGTGLVAVFAEGGQREAISTIEGAGGSGGTSPWGILPKALRVPEAHNPVQVDGVVNLGTEYANAEQLVLRYKLGSGEVDARAHLVYRNEPGDENLYIAIENLAPTIPSATWYGVLLDPNHLQRELAGSQDRQLRIPAQGSPEWLEGTGFGGYFRMAPQPSSTLWDVFRGFCDEFSPCVEVRLAEALLNDFTTTNGLALIHWWGMGVGEHDMAPADATYISPKTWAPISYGSGTPVSQVTFEGFVKDPATGAGIAGYPVMLVDESSGSLLHSRTTDGSGFFAFSNVEVAQGRKLKLVIEQCIDCLGQPPSIEPGGIAPERAGLFEIVYPACGTSSCTYSEVTFFMQQPPGPIRLTDFQPKSAAPEIILRETPLKRLPPDTVTIEGENLHEQISVYLYSCLDTPPLSSCVEGRDYYEAEIVHRLPFQLTVKMPIVPQADWSRPWFWVVRDNWNRPERIEWSRIGDRPENRFLIAPAEFPRTHGFEFENEFDSPRFDEFTAVFGNNAFVCLGLEIDGVCAGCRVIDPLYLPYAGVYAAWINGPNGSCNGMASTALLFFQGDLEPSAFQTGANYAAGLRGNLLSLASGSIRGSAGLNGTTLPPRVEATSSADFFDSWMVDGFVQFESGYHFMITNVASPTLAVLEEDYSPSIMNETFMVGKTNHPPRPARYSFAPCDGPAEPLNLWAHISVNHGVQTSAEYIDRILRQMDSPGAIPNSGPVSSISGNPVEVLEYVRANLGNCVISMMPEVGRGHVVTPYAVESVPGDPDLHRIRIYENNWPQDTRHFILIDSAENRYRFPRRDRETWSGTGIYAIPIAVWRNSRSMPGLSTIGDALGLIVFGEAHALHTDSEGRRWGWDAAGDFHETLPNARAITPTGGSADESTRNVALFLPAVQALPRSTVHVSGKYYIFHTALGGNLVQLEMFSGVAGDQDEFQAFADGSKITGFSFSPERMDHEVVPRIGMVLGERQRALFEWQGMSPPAGAKLGFHAVNDRKGVKFENRLVKAIDEGPSTVVNCI